MSDKDAMGKLILEAATGQHGEIAKQIANEWAAMSELATSYRAQIDAVPKKNFVNMGAHALATELGEAVRKDEAEEGLDMGAGLFGTHTSAWLRHVAATYLANPAPENKCGEAHKPGGR